MRVKRTLFLAKILFVIGLVGSSSILRASDLSLNVQKWKIQPNITYNYKTYHPTPNLGGGWSFEFPLVTDVEVDFKSVNYVTTKPPKLRIGQVITITGEIVASDDIVFEFAKYPDSIINQCDVPANFRLYFQNGLGNRWWSLEWQELEAGPFELSVLVIPENWSDVNGRLGTQSLKQFNKAVSKANGVGFTLGGGCFAGHGDWVEEGSAEMFVIRFSIQ